MALPQQKFSAGEVAASPFRSLPGWPEPCQVHILNAKPYTMHTLQGSDMGMGCCLSRGTGQAWARPGGDEAW